jgi:AbrB family looped-hinge helix DNA binding protein
MQRVKVHHNQITLPDEASRALKLAEGDELDLEVAEDGLFLRLTPEVRRRIAVARLREIRANVRLSPEWAALTPEQCEEEIAAILEAEKGSGDRRRG